MVSATDVLPLVNCKKKISIFDSRLSHCTINQIIMGNLRFQYCPQSNTETSPVEHISIDHWLLKNYLNQQSHGKLKRVRHILFSLIDVNLCIL